MGERAGSPWVGDPGRLSLEDSERFSDDSERLVCSRFDCFVILRKRELRFLLGYKEGTIYSRLDSRIPGSSNNSIWDRPPPGPAHSSYNPLIKAASSPDSVLSGSSQIPTYDLPRSNSQIKTEPLGPTHLS